MMQCNFEHCPGPFHPTCAREAGLYISVRVGAAGQLQYREYCDTHSVLQRPKGSMHFCNPLTQTVNINSNIIN
jgi:hypothetical protein